MPEKRLDLQHLQRITAVLDGIPGDVDLPHAILALEDAYAVCCLALQCGLSLEQARELHREEYEREERLQILREDRRLSNPQSPL